MYWQGRFNRTSPDAQLEKKIKAIRQRDKDFGYRRICGKLREYGIMVNHKKVQRLVQKLSLQVTGHVRSQSAKAHEGICIKKVINKCI